MDVEHACISEILLGRELGPVLEVRLDSGFFSDREHRQVFELIIDHYGKYRAVPSIDAVHDAYPNYHVGDGYDEPLDFYVAQVRERHLFRILTEGVKGVIESIAEDGPDSGQRAYNQMSELVLKARMEVPAGFDEDVFVDSYELLMEELERRRVHGYLRGIDTGFENLNQATGGLQPEQLITIIGLPGTGKSTMLLYLANKAADAGRRCLLVTFEMSVEEQRDRITSLISEVPLSAILSGQLTKKELDKIKYAYTTRKGLEGYMTFVSDRTSTLTLTGLQAKINEYQPDAVFVDGVYFMEDERGEPPGSPRALTNITRGLKRMAQSNRIPVVISTQALAQKSRGGVNIHSAGYCVDERTEILTKDGWRFHSDLTGTEEVLALDHETGLTHWQPLIAVHRFPAHRWEMLRMEGRNHSSLTTLNHRWPVVAKQRWGDERRWATSGTLKSNDRIITGAPCGDLPIAPTHSDALVEALAWFWTEGGIRTHGGVVITQSYKHGEDNVMRIRDALEAVLGPEHVGDPVFGRSDGVPRWTMKVRENRPLVEFCLNKAAGAVLLEHAPDKVVSYQFLRELTRDQLELFIEVSMLADNNGKNSLSQKDRWRSEAFGYAAILSGAAVSYREDPPTKNTPYPMHRVRMRTTVNNAPVLAAALAKREGMSDGFVMESVIHDGMVWCPEVPSGTWLARRDGTTYFTGNSSSFAQDSDVIFIVEALPKPNESVSAFRADKVRSGPNATEYVRMGWDEGRIVSVDPVLLGIDRGVDQSDAPAPEWTTRRSYGED